MGDAAYIVLKGRVAVFIETEKGPVEVAQLKRGDVVGEISILCDVPRTASVKAVESVRTLKVTKDTLKNLLPMTFIPSRIMRMPQVYLT